jgi:hypothetical protein
MPTFNCQFSHFIKKIAMPKINNFVTLRNCMLSINRFEFGCFWERWPIVRDFLKFIHIVYKMAAFLEYDEIG